MMVSTEAWDETLEDLMSGIILYKQSDTIRQLSATSFLRCATVALVIACIVASPLFLANTLPLEQAHAATWPLGGSQASVSTAFHQTYSYNGKELLHSGVDISAEAGQDVVAPVSGTVSFVGRVPAGDSYLSEGGNKETMRAVSVLLEDKRTVTLMPLEDIVVTKGMTVSEGGKIGSLAASGDRSLKEPHLHIGLKKDGVYYDPAQLFPALAKERQLEPDTKAEQAVAASAVQQEKAALQPQQARDGTSSAPVDSAEVPESFGSISSGAVSWAAEDFQEGSAPLEGVAALLYDVGGACSAQALMIYEGVGHVSQMLGMPRFLLSTLLFATATLLGAVALKAAVSVLSAVKSPYVNRKNRLLYRIMQGDIMQKLFPAPGHPS